jgi:hypothetical protein
MKTDQPYGARIKYGTSELINCVSRPGCNLDEVKAICERTIKRLNPENIDKIEFNMPSFDKDFEEGVVYINLDDDNIQCKLSDDYWIDDTHFLKEPSKDNQYYRDFLRFFSDNRISDNAVLAHVSGSHEWTIKDLKDEHKMITKADFRNKLLDGIKKIPKSLCKEILSKTINGEENIAFNAITRAIYYGKTNLIKYLLSIQEYDFTLPSKGKTGISPFFAAVKFGHFEAFQCFINHFYNQTIDNRYLDLKLRSKTPVEILSSKKERKSVLYVFQEQQDWKYCISAPHQYKDVGTFSKDSGVIDKINQIIRNKRSIHNRYQLNDNECLQIKECFHQDNTYAKFSVMPLFQERLSRARDQENSMQTSIAHNPLVLSIIYIFNTLVMLKKENGISLENFQAILSDLLSRYFLHNENLATYSDKVTEDVQYFFDYPSNITIPSIRERLESSTKMSELTDIIHDYYDTSDDDDSDDEVDEIQLISPPKNKRQHYEILTRGFHFTKKTQQCTKKDARKPEYHKQIELSDATRTFLENRKKRNGGKYSIKDADTIIKYSLDTLRCPQKDEGETGVNGKIKYRTEAHQFSAQYLRLVQAQMNRNSKHYTSSNADDRIIMKNVKSFRNKSPFIFASKTPETAFEDGAGCNNIDEIEINCYLPKIRRCTGEFKHRRIGFVRLYAINKAQYANHMVDINAELSQGVIGISQQYKFNQEILIESSIPKKAIVGYQLISLPSFKKSWDNSIKEKYGLSKKQYSDIKRSFKYYIFKKDVEKDIKRLIAIVSSHQAKLFRKAIDKLFLDDSHITNNNLTKPEQKKSKPVSQKIQNNKQVVSSQYELKKEILPIANLDLLDRKDHVKQDETEPPLREKTLKTYRIPLSDTEENKQLVYDCDVPGYGACLFYAIVAGALLDVFADYDAFSARFCLLFGKEKTDQTNAVYNLIDNYRKNSQPKHLAKDPLKTLIDKTLRLRVTDHIKKEVKKGVKPGISQETYEELLLNGQDDPLENRWGNGKKKRIKLPELNFDTLLDKLKYDITEFAGTPVIYALSDMLQIPVRQYQRSSQNTAANIMCTLAHTPQKAKTSIAPITIFYVNRDHYHVFIQPRFLKISSTVAATENFQFVPTEKQNNLSPKGEPLKETQGGNKTTYASCSKDTDNNVQHSISKANKTSARTQKLITFANQSLQQYNLALGKATDIGDCFFDAFAQQLNIITGSIKYHAVILRRKCATYAQYVNKADTGEGRSDESIWFKAAVEQDKKNSPYLHYNSWSDYTHKINKMQTAITDKALAIYGRPSIEGRFFCGVYQVTLHVINIQFLNPDKYWQEDPHIDHRFYDGKGLVKDQSVPNYKKNRVVRLVCYANHFSPVIPKNQNSNQLAATTQLNSHENSAITEVKQTKSSDEVQQLTARFSELLVKKGGVQKKNNLNVSREEHSPKLSRRLFKNKKPIDNKKQLDVPLFLSGLKHKGIYVIGCQPINSSGDIYHILAYLMLCSHHAAPLPEVWLTYDEPKNKKSTNKTELHATRAAGLLSRLGFNEQLVKQSIGLSRSGQSPARLAALMALIKRKNKTGISRHMVDQKAVTGFISQYIKKHGLKAAQSILRRGFLNFSNINQQELQKMKCWANVEKNKLIKAAGNRKIIVLNYRYSKAANSDQNLSEKGILLLQQEINRQGLFLWTLVASSEFKNTALENTTFLFNSGFGPDLDKKGYYKIRHIVLLNELYRTILKNSKVTPIIIGNTSGTFDLAAFMGWRAYDFHPFVKKAKNNNHLRAQDYRVLLQTPFMAIGNSIDTKDGKMQFYAWLKYHSKYHSFPKPLNKVFTISNKKKGKLVDTDYSSHQDRLPFSHCLIWKKPPKLNLIQLTKRKTEPYICLFPVFSLIDSDVRCRGLYNTFVFWLMGVFSRCQNRLEQKEDSASVLKVAELCAGYTQMDVKTCQRLGL